MEERKAECLKTKRRHRARATAKENRVAARGQLDPSTSQGLTLALAPTALNDCETPYH